MTLWLLAVTPTVLPADERTNHSCAGVGLARTRRSLNRQNATLKPWSHAFCGNGRGLGICL